MPEQDTKPSYITPENIKLILLMVAALLGTGTTSLIASGQPPTTEDIERSRSAQNQIMSEVKAIQRSIDGDPATNDPGLRGDIEFLGDRQDAALEDIERIKARDKARDEALGMEEALKDYPLERQKSWRGRKYKGRRTITDR